MPPHTATHCNTLQHPPSSFALSAFVCPHLWESYETLVACTVNLHSIRVDTSMTCRHLWLVSTSIECRSTYTRTQIYKRIHKWTTCICVFVRLRILIYMYMYMYMHAYTHKYENKVYMDNMYLIILKYMYMYMQTYICICTYIFVDMYTDI